VRVAGLQSQQVLDIEPRIHARDNGQPLAGLDRLLAGMGGGVNRLSLRVFLVALISGHPCCATVYSPIYISLNRSDMGYYICL
jgi:hypothetical protein